MFSQYMISWTPELIEFHPCQSFSLPPKWRAFPLQKRCRRTNSGSGHPISLCQQSPSHRSPRNVIQLWVPAATAAARVKRSDLGCDLGSYLLIQKADPRSCCAVHWKTNKSLNDSRFSQSMDNSYSVLSIGGDRDQQTGGVERSRSRRSQFGNKIASSLLIHAII